MNTIIDLESYENANLRPDLKERYSVVSQNKFLDGEFKFRADGSGSSCDNCYFFKNKIDCKGAFDCYDLTCVQVQEIKVNKERKEMPENENSMSVQWEADLRKLEEELTNQEKKIEDLVESLKDAKKLYEQTTAKMRELIAMGSEDWWNKRPLLKNQ